VAYLYLACTTMLVIVFLSAVVGKLRRFSAFLRVVRDLAPAGAFFRALGVLVVLAECLAVVLLVVPQSAPLGLVAAVALLGVFTVGIQRAIARGSRTACACFGVSSTMIGRHHLIRNAALIAVAATGLVAHSQTAALAQWANPAGAALAVAAGALAALPVVQLDHIVALFSPTRQS